MGLVVRQVRDQSLIDVEHPHVPPVSSDLHRLREGERVLGHDLRVRRVPLAGHVVLHEALAPRRNGGPVPGVVGLDGEPPAVAVQIVIYPDFAVSGDQLDYRMGNSGGDKAEEEEASWDEVLAGGHCRKSKELSSEIFWFSFSDNKREKERDLEFLVLGQWRIGCSLSS